MRDVVVTGVGCVTPAGTGADDLWRGLKAQRSNVRTITRFDAARFRTRIAAEVPDFRPQDHMTTKAAKRFDRFSSMGVASARLAVEDAGLKPDVENRDRIGVMMGSALGGIAFAEEQFPAFMAEGIRAVDPALALGVFGGAVSCNIAIEFGFTGPNATDRKSVV